MNDKIKIDDYKKEVNKKRDSWHDPRRPELSEKHFEKEHIKETYEYKLGYERGAVPPHHLLYKREMIIPINSFSKPKIQVPRYVAGWQDGRRVSENAGKLKDGFFIVGETKTGYTLRNNRGEKEIAKDEIKYYKDYTN